MKSQKGIWVALIAVAIIAIGGYFYPAVAGSVFGSVSCQSTTCLEGGLRITTGALEADGTSQIGASGTSLSQVLEGKSSLIASSFTVGATTTVSMDIAVTGALTGDTVFASFATTSAIGGWAIVGASASTTAGFDTLRVMNLTGASNVIPASIASSSVSYHNSR